MDIFIAQPDSMLSRLDPRLRLVSALAFAIPVSFLRQPSALAAALAMGVVLAMLSRRPWRGVLKRTATLNVILLLLGATLAVAWPGEVVWRLGPADVTREGLVHAAIILVRANAILLGVAALLGSMEPAQLGIALDRLGVPALFSQILLFMVRYVEVIHHEYHRLRDAMEMRGFQPRYNLLTFRSFGYLFGLLLVRSLDRAERILAAMKCRGFHGRFYVLHTFRWMRGDAVFGLVSAAAVLLILSLEIAR